MSSLVGMKSAKFPQTPYVGSVQTKRAAGSDQLESNSNQGSPNTQTLPTLTLFLPLQVHGSWLFFCRALEVGYSPDVWDPVKVGFALVETP